MKQSAAILALFLGTTSAVQLRAWGDDKKEAAPLPPEKVHNLKPTHAQDLSNNLDPEYPTFPQPVGLGAGRTAFYAQKGAAPVGTGDNAPDWNKQSVAGPDVTDQIGKSVHDPAMEGGDPIPNRRDVLGNHPKSFVPGDVPPIPAAKDKVVDEPVTEEDVKKEETKKKEEEKKADAAAPKKEEEKKADAPAKEEKKADAAPAKEEKKADAAPAKEEAKAEAAPAKEEKLLTEKSSDLKKKGKDPISEDEYDPWVFQFSRDNMPALDRMVNRTDKPAEYGWHPSNQHPSPRGFGSYGSNSLNQKSSQDIAYKNIDESVHEFAYEDTSVHPTPYPRQENAYSVNGHKNPDFQWIDEKKASLSQHGHKHHHRHHHNKRDIGDQGIDEAVHGFASNDKSVLPQPWRRAKEAYPVNGFLNPTWQHLPQKKHHHHHKAKDIGDQGIAEEVQQFASNDKSVLPQPWRRAKEAYPINGFKNPSWQHLSLNQKKHHHHHKARDIGDQGIAEEVQQFASNDKSVLPKPWRRAKEAYPVNGFKNPKWQWLSLSEQEKRDIGDQGIDEAVHGFASNDKSVLPQPWRRAKEAYPANGFKNPDFQWVDKKSLAQHDKLDIGDKKIDEGVHGFAAKDTNMQPTPYPREEHANNGVLNPSFQHLPQKQDIGNSKYVRPDVYHFVNENIGQVPTYRRKTAPDHTFEPGKSGQGVEIVSSGPSSGTKSLAQVHGDGEGEAEGPAPVKAPEKVAVLQPQEYQHRANTNTPNLRTTFYAQQEQ